MLKASTKESGSGKSSQAIVIIDPDSSLFNMDIGQGEQAEFVLTAYIDGIVVGGVNFFIIHTPDVTIDITFWEPSNGILHN